MFCRRCSHRSGRAERPPCASAWNLATQTTACLDCTSPFCLPAPSSAGPWRRTPLCRAADTPAQRCARGLWPQKRPHRGVVCASVRHIACGEAITDLTDRATRLMQQVSIGPVRRSHELLSASHRARLDRHFRCYTSNNWGTLRNFQSCTAQTSTWFSRGKEVSSMRRSYVNHERIIFR